MKEEIQGITKDPICNQVIELIVKRHIQGMETFGTTMAANNRPINEWVDETIEELLDAIHYLVKTKSIFNKFKEDNRKLQAALKNFEEGSFKNVQEEKQEQTTS